MTCVEEGQRGGQMGPRTDPGSVLIEFLCCWQQGPHSHGGRVEATVGLESHGNLKFYVQST